MGSASAGREDDYEHADVGTETRGRDLDAMLARIKEVWDDDKMGPHTGTQPRILVGGSVAASFERAAKFGDGWIAAGAPPDQFAEWREKFEGTWSGSGRSEAPQNAALAYFSLGDRAEEEAQAYLTDYYAWLGDEVAGFIADSAAKDPDTVKQYLAGFEQAGCQELFLFPSSSDPAQVDLLADAAGM
ncbi:MAG: LLM class flavin-dependent oxidoreductase [Actinomycetota bacterium]|nr:LLM class flavin-dependent oxidoreductase [Actinomycetota bacterium]